MQMDTIGCNCMQMDAIACKWNSKRDGKPSANPRGNSRHRVCLKVTKS